MLPTTLLSLPSDTEKLSTEYIITSLMSTTSRGVITQSGHTRQTHPALRLHLVDEASSVGLVRALLRGRPVERALVQRVVLLLLLGVGRAVRSGLVLLPPCTRTQASGGAKTAAHFLSFFENWPRQHRGQTLRSCGESSAQGCLFFLENWPHRHCKRMTGKTCLGVLPRDAAAAAAVHVRPPRQGLSCRCLHWRGLQQHTSPGFLCSSDPCDMPCWRRSLPSQRGGHSQSVSIAEDAQVIACLCVCFLSQSEGSEAGAWQS